MLHLLVYNVQCESYKKKLRHSIPDSAKVPILQPKRLELWIEWDRLVEGLYELGGAEYINTGPTWHITKII